jgi:RNA polymerase sigma-70 factor, ECF subfamily
MSRSLKFEFDEDVRLMRRAANGDSAAFDRFYEKYEPVVTHYLISLDGYHLSLEDLTQEVFARLLQYPERFQGNSSIKTYLLGIARKVMLEDFRRLAKEKMVHGDRFLRRNLSSRSTISPDPQAEAVRTELVQMMKQAQTQLVARQRQALESRYANGMSLQECAKQSNCSVVAFKGRLHRACEQLRQFLKPAEKNKVADSGQNRPNSKKITSATPCDKRR